MSRKVEYSPEGNRLTPTKRNVEWEPRLLDMARKHGVEHHYVIEEHGNRYHRIDFADHSPEHYITNPSQPFLDELDSIIRQRKDES